MGGNWQVGRAALRFVPLLDGQDSSVLCLNDCY